MTEVFFPRPQKRITKASIAILVFLTMAALFFCVPLYVLVATSLKSMDQIREGDIFALPRGMTFDAWDYAWTQACSGMNCNGLKTGFVNSLMILFPSLTASIALAMVTGYALATGTCAEPEPFCSYYLSAPSYRSRSSCIP